MRGGDSAQKPVTHRALWAVEVKMGGPGGRAVSAGFRLALHAEGCGLADTELLPSPWVLVPCSCAGLQS